MDLTVLIPARDEAENLRVLLPKLRTVLEGLRVNYEVIILDGDSMDETSSVARASGARRVHSRLFGYGNALREGFRAARGRYVLTMDADQSHDPDGVESLWRHREDGEMVIASRYVPGGAARRPWIRGIFSVSLNKLLMWGWSIPVRDLSSGFRIYHHTLLEQIECFGAEFDLLPEIAVKAWMGGWKVAEIPFTCFRRGAGRSKVRWIRLAFSFLGTFLKLSSTRYSVAAADYDERAFYGVIPIQRSWQRRRVKEIHSFALRPGRILDVGCGSSVILRGLDKAIGLDLRHSKTRYMRRYGLPMVTASIVGIPFAEASFDSVICSQVIEHVPADSRVFTELDRVLKPGGRLILGTPDYSRWTWRLIERLYGLLLPGGYDMPSEHITHYHRAGLVRLLQTMGYRQIQCRYVFRSELILAAIKPDLPTPFSPARLPVPPPLPA